jgi:hypothetical protein
VQTDDAQRAAGNEVQIGDNVIMRKEKKGKLDANFGKEKHTVVGKEGSELVCADENGKAVRRNSTFVKVLSTSSSNAGVMPSSSPYDAGSCRPGELDGHQHTAGAPVGSPVMVTPQRRSRRCGKPPERFGDFVVHALGYYE